MPAIKLSVATVQVAVGSKELVPGFWKVQIGRDTGSCAVGGESARLSGGGHAGNQTIRGNGPSGRGVKGTGAWVLEGSGNDQNRRGGTDEGQQSQETRLAAI